MTTPNTQTEIKYTGSGTDSEQLFFPFPIRDASALHVYTIDSAGVETLKILDTDYSAVFSDTGESGSGLGDFGWVTWIGISPTDTIVVSRREVPKQENAFTGTIDPDKVEQSADRVAQVSTTGLGRDDSDPSVFGAGNKTLGNAGQPVRGDDAVTKKNLDLTKGDTGLDIPSTTTTGRLLIPTALLPSTPAASWRDKFDTPALPADNTDVLESQGIGDSTAWVTTSNFIEPHDGTGEDMHLTELSKGAMGWKQIYEIPSGGSIDNIVELNSFGKPEWKQPVETPITTDAHVSSRHVTTGYDRKSPPLVAGVGFGRRFKYGTEDITVTSTSATGKHTDNIFDFTISHGLLNDTGAAIIPEQVWLQVECPTTAGSEYPVYTAYLNNTDVEHAPDTFGLTTTALNGKIVMWNCDEFGASPATLTWTGDLTVKLHWMVGGDG